MKLKRSKQWFKKRIALEGDNSVEAGIPPWAKPMNLKTSITRLKKQIVSAKATERLRQRAYPQCWEFFLEWYKVQVKTPSEKPPKISDKKTGRISHFTKLVPDTKKPANYRVFLKVGGQSFRLDENHTKTEEAWLRQQIGIALQNLIQQHQKP